MTVSGASFIDLYEVKADAPKKVKIDFQFFALTEVFFLEAQFIDPKF